jgi:hypothetical protein
MRDAHPAKAFVSTGPPRSARGTARIGDHVTTFFDRIDHFLDQAASALDGRTPLPPSPRQALAVWWAKPQTTALIEKGAS